MSPVPLPSSYDPSEPFSLWPVDHLVQLPLGVFALRYVVFHALLEQPADVQEVVQMFTPGLVVRLQLGATSMDGVTEIQEPLSLQRAERPLLRFQPLLD